MTSDGDVMEVHTMGSMARANRRRAQRAMANMSAEQAGAVVEAMHEAATARYKAAADIAPEVVAQCQKKMEGDVIPRVQGNMCLLFFGWLAFGQKDNWGKKRLTEGLLDFNKFCDIVMSEPLDILKRQLYEEKRFDIDAVFAKAEAQSKLYEKSCELRNAV